jgi:ankyrin repeat domain-containing protein 17
MYHTFLPGIQSLANACLEGNVNAVRKLLEQGWSVHDSTDEGESLLSLACSAGKIRS